MKVLKAVFARIWCLWGLVLFVLTMLVMMPFALIISFLPEPVRTHRFIQAARIWMQLYLPLIGCPVRINGKHFFQSGQPYIVVCNHNNFLDVPVSSPGIPGGNKTIAKMEMARIPVFGFWYRMGSVLVDRKSDQSRRESFSKMKAVLEQGLHMCIYPEGTRNKSNEPLKPFHDGAFKLSKETGKYIIPAVIFHTRKVIPPDQVFFLWPHRLQMDFLSPMNPADFTDLLQLKQAVFDRMKAHYQSQP